MCILLFLVSCALVQDPSSPTRRVSELIESLRSEKLEERNSAVRQLKELGETARTALEKASENSDVELSLRARSILRVLDVRRKLPPEVVRLLPGLVERFADGNATWVDVLSEVSQNPFASNTPREKRAMRGILSVALKESPDLLKREAVLEDVGYCQFREAIPSLIGLLNHQDEKVRKSAAAALGELRAKEAVAPILAMPNLIENKKAIEALGRIGSKEALPKLKELSKSGTGPGTYDAIRALGKVGGREAIPDLFPLLKDKDWFSRLCAVNALRDIGDPSVVNELKPLLNDPSPIVRSGTVGAVVPLAGLETVGMLLDLFATEKDAHVRTSVMIELGLLKPDGLVEKALPLLKVPDPGFRGEVLNLLLKTDPKAIVPSLPGLLSDPVEGIRHQAVWALVGTKGGKSIPLILPLLKDSSAVIRMEVLHALETLDAKDAIAELRPLASDPDLLVRWTARAALAKCGERELLPDLLKQLDSEDSLAWGAAIRPLGYLRAKEAIPRLVALFEHASRSDRINIGLALADMHDPNAVGLLAPFLGSKDPGSRTSALEAMQGLGGTALPIVLPSLKDPDPAVRVAALACLSHWSDVKAAAEVVPLLRDASPKLRDLAMQYVVRFGDAETAALVRSDLDASAAQIRRNAVRILGEFRVESAAPRIMAMLQDSDPAQRSLLILALGRLKAKEAPALLLSLLADEAPEIRLSAVVGLAEFDSEEVVGALIDRLKDDDTSVRSRAVEALRRSPSEKAFGRVLELLRIEEGFEIRLAAIRVIAQWGEPRAIPILRPLLEDSDARIRRAAGGALCRLGDVAALEPFLAAASNEVESVVDYGRGFPGDADDLHWWLNGLNALRRPERWKAMSRDKGLAMQDEKGHALVEAILRRNALRTFEPLRDSGYVVWTDDLAFPPDARFRLPPEGLAGGGWRRVQLTSLEALDILFGRQEGLPGRRYEGRGYILEEDGVRNLEVEGAIAFWKKWAKERK